MASSLWEHCSSVHQSRVFCLLMRTFLSPWLSSQCFVRCTFRASPMFITFVIESSWRRYRPCLHLSWGSRSQLWCFDCSRGRIWCVVHYKNFIETFLPCGGNVLVDISSLWQHSSCWWYYDGSYKSRNNPRRCNCTTWSFIVLVNESPLWRYRAGMRQSPVYLSVAVVPLGGS